MEELFESVVTKWQSLQRAEPAEFASSGEARLRANHAQLLSQDLSSDEAALIALIRQGPTPASRELALDLVDSLLPASRPLKSRAVWAAVLTALAAGFALKLPSLFFESGSGDSGTFYLRNAALLLLPFSVLYFAFLGRLKPRWWLLLAAGLVVGVSMANLLPWQSGGKAELLFGLHLPVALLPLLALAMLDDQWRDVEARLRFVRFCVEWFVLLSLVALGGGVLLGLLTALLSQVGIGVDLVWQWLVVVAAGGAFVLTSAMAAGAARFVAGASTLLARIFVPLFALMLAGFFTVVLATGRFAEFDRNLLFTFDAVLLIVSVLTLYACATRNPLALPHWQDWALLALAVVAVLVDVFALGSTLIRVWDLGWTANRTAAIGLNLVLLVNLVGSAFLLGRFTLGSHRFEAVLNWQTRYLPVHFAWAAAVCAVFPLAFGLN